jgi:DNA-binding transcriptional MerR regulator
MEYSIQELSRMAGISTRTLRYYDETGLLKPARVTQAGYRYYGTPEVDRLQQILYYRERGFQLHTIQKILQDRDFDKLRAMEDHLAALKQRQEETAALIRTVEQTIRHMKGECQMADREKFKALKKSLVQGNEIKFGAEARAKYGDAQVDAANKNMMGLSEEDFARWQALEQQILQELEAAVQAGQIADSETGKRLAQLHRDWLRFTLPGYTPAQHKGIAALYVADERFTQYYDRRIPGCAQWLSDAVQHWI